MILPSTLRKLQAANKTVFRIVWPAHAFTMPASRDGITPERKVEMPELREYFATQRGMNDRYESQFEMIEMGMMPRAHMSEIPATALDWLTCREVNPQPVKG